MPTHTEWKKEVFDGRTLHALMAHVVSMLQGHDTEEMIAIRSAFLEILFLDAKDDEDKSTAATMAQAFDEIILAAMLGEDEKFEAYLDHRNAELEALRFARRALGYGS